MGVFRLLSVEIYPLGLEESNPLLALFGYSHPFFLRPAAHCLAIQSPPDSTRNTVFRGVR
jgi:hypothetical protein